MKLSKPCEVCKKEYSPRKDKILTSKTCSQHCKSVYAGRIGREKKLEEWNSKSEEETKKEIQKSFDKFVIRQQGCWGWRGSTKGKKFKYGQVSFRGKGYLAHRISYELYISKIPEGMSVLHKCDNPSCTNPEHLFLGTYLDNKRDQIKKGRSSVERLNIEKVKEIKKLISENYYHKDIAKKYSISTTTVWSIETGRTWSDISI